MNLGDFTEGIIIEILSRTPAKDLVVFKTVCKLWYNIISDSSFVNAHLHYCSNNSRSQKEIILTASDEEYYHREHECMVIKIDSERTKVKKLDMNNVIRGQERVSLKTGCNGLSLLQGYSYEEFYICNLVTGEFTALPRINEPKHPFVIQCKWALFYDTSVERYKVFAIWREDAIMLTSGDEKWTNMTIPTRIRMPEQIYQQLTPLVFAERKLHWLVYYSDFIIGGKRMVCACSLDVKSREYREIKLTDYVRHCAIFAPLNAKGYVSVTLVFYDHLEIWGLVHNGNNQWTKNISVDLQSLSNSILPQYFWSDMYIVGVKEDTDSNEISDMKLKLFIRDGRKELLYQYDGRSGELRKIANMNKKLSLIKAYHFHVDSLVSWHPAQAKEKRKTGKNTEYDRTTIRDCNQPTANDYIELRNKKKIPRRCY